MEELTTNQNLAKKTVLINKILIEFFFSQLFLSALKWVLLSWEISLVFLKMTFIFGEVGKFPKNLS